MRELGERGYQPHVVELPHSWVPTAKSGVRKMLTKLPSLSHNDIIIAHSFGARVALKYLEQFSGTIAATILVAPLYRWMTLGPIRWVWSKGTINFSAIVGKSTRIFILHAANDELVPVENGRALAAGLGAEYIEPAVGGHFCPADKCLKLPQIRPFLNQVP